ncbi:hypothetical protein TKWG_06600 [Advenella kashmirensis WT001]|uniref:Uncharacterized protein n=1 Tax=Advenella kashmirensis (strain DSM 17095 / LMG 22695 / WT001) TaxID=1036672 RepID=I3U9S1_ADVKW|nr:hypothetical protein TKWG_06600 [Advenella kashmirensis WT001]
MNYLKCNSESAIGEAAKAVIFFNRLQSCLFRGKIVFNRLQAAGNAGFTRLICFLLLVCLI